MLKKILLGVLAVVVVFLVVVALQPAAFHIERSIAIAANPERPFAVVNDFHSWPAWSPWEGKDPAMQRSYSGPPMGVGAGYAWSGNQEVGQGRMTIEKSEPAQIVIKLEFLKPFAATNTATYSFAPAPGGTQVTWAMDGTNNFFAKAFSLFVNMDKLVGADFEKGLGSLKRLIEGNPGPTVPK